MGQILDVSDGEGGDYIELVKSGKLLAWGLERFGSIKEHPETSKIYAAEPFAGNVVLIDPSNDPQNYRFEPPVIRNLLIPTCIRFNSNGSIMYVCGLGEGAVWQISNFRI